jgi:predicted nucleic acid-binding protein
MKVYTDSCIFGRQNDDQTQPDIQKDTLAIVAIFKICRIDGHAIIGSNVVESEIMQNPDSEDRLENLAYFANTVKPENILNLTAANFGRARELIADGLRNGDAYHLAVAESCGADVVLTVDKDFIKIATNKKLSKVRVLNPSTFLKELAI